MAHELFNGKYTMTELNTMPYRELLENIEREQAFQKKIEEARNKEAKRIQQQQTRH